MKFYLHLLMVCAVLTACGGGGGDGTDTNQLATAVVTSGSSIISNAGGTVSINGNTVVELSAGASTLPATVTALIRPTTAGGLADEVVVDLSATEPSEADVNEVTVYIYPASVQQAAPTASQRTAATGLTSSDAVAATKPLETFKFANSTVPYTLDQLSVVGTTGENIKLLASRLLFDSAKGVIKATFRTASAAASTVKALKNKPATFVVNVIATNNDNTTRLFYFPTRSSDGIEINTLATAQTKIPLVLVHGIQLVFEGCGRNSGYKSTWAKFRANFFNDVDTASKYDLYSFSYPTNLDFKTNGAALSQKLSAAFGDKPVVVVAHSMGGLVTRAADVYYSSKAQSGNTTDINIAKVITLDTPHRGTPYVNDAGTIREVLCIGPAASAGAPSLAWDDLDENGSCTNSRNPTLCELNRPQSLQHLKKYVPYSAYADLGTLTSYAGTGANELLFLIRKLFSGPIALKKFFNLDVIENYFSNSAAKRSDIAVLVPSQRLMMQSSNQWVDMPNIFADVPETYSETLHIELGETPGIATSAKVWSKKADGTPGGIRAHLLVFEAQLADKPVSVTSIGVPTGLSPQGALSPVNGVVGTSYFLSWNYVNTAVYYNWEIAGTDLQTPLTGATLSNRIPVELSPNGTFNWEVSACRYVPVKVCSATINATFTTPNVPAPGSPTLLLPINNSTTIGIRTPVGSSVSFKWTAVPGAEYYKLQAYRASENTAVDASFRVNGTEISIGGFSPGLHAWRVASCIPLVCSPFSPENYFTLTTEAPSTSYFLASGSRDLFDMSEQSFGSPFGNAYTPNFSIYGSGLYDVSDITWTWNGATNGSTTWSKSSSGVWLNERGAARSVSIVSSTQIDTIPTFITASDTWKGTLNWTVKLCKSSGVCDQLNLSVKR